MRTQCRLARAWRPSSSGGSGSSLACGRWAASGVLFTFASCAVMSLCTTTTTTRVVYSNSRNVLTLVHSHIIQRNGLSANRNHTLQGVRRQVVGRTLWRDYVRGLQGLLQALAIGYRELPMCQTKELHCRQSEQEQMSVLSVAKVHGVGYVARRGQVWPHVEEATREG